MIRADVSPSTDIASAGTAASSKSTGIAATDIVDAAKTDSVGDSLIVSYPEGGLKTPR
jgi:hypothetical protein